MLTFITAYLQLLHIPRDTFIQLKHLKMLSLFGNQLIVPIATWFLPVLSNKGDVDINGKFLTTRNPWNCCHANISLFLRHLRVMSTNPDFTFFCSSPYRLQNRTMTSLSDDDVICNSSQVMTSYPLVTTPTARFNVSKKLMTSQLRSDNKKAVTSQSVDLSTSQKSKHLDYYF